MNSSASQHDPELARAKDLEPDTKPIPKQNEEPQRTGPNLGLLYMLLALALLAALGVAAMIVYPFYIRR